MKMSSAPSFGAPGGHIFDVVAHGVKKHVFTACLHSHSRQHVCRKYVKSQKARGRGTGTPVHTRHKHSVEYDEGTREEVKRETRGGRPHVFFSFSCLFIG
jgi:hypothetical protein